MARPLRPYHAFLGELFLELQKKLFFSHWVGPYPPPPSLSGRATFLLWYKDALENIYSYNQTLREFERPREGDWSIS